MTRDQDSLQRLSRLMDSSIRLPGGYRIGLDGIIGLVPGIGDLVGLGVSAYIIMRGAQAGASRSVVLRMVTNVAIETAVGIIPVVGDLFDFAFKANNRNMALLVRHQNDASNTDRSSRLFVWGLLGALLGSFVLLGWLALKLLGGLFALLF